MALSYLSLSVTQGGADAFAISAGVQTALEGQTARAFRVREIIWQFDRMSGGAISNTNVEMALCRRSKTAMPNITDRDVMSIVKWSVELAGAAGAVLLDAVRRFPYSEDDELLIVENELFLAIDSNATTLTHTGLCRIGYELVNINAVDRLTLLTQSLQ